MFWCKRPMRRHTPSGDWSGYHPTVGHSGSSVSVWDPENGPRNSTGGVHTELPSQVYAAEQVHGLEMVG